MPVLVRAAPRHRDGVLQGSGRRLCDRWCWLLPPSRDVGATSPSALLGGASPCTALCPGAARIQLPAGQGSRWCRQRPWPLSEFTGQGQCWAASQRGCLRVMVTLSAPVSRSQRDVSKSRKESSTAHSEDSHVGRHEPGAAALRCVSAELTLQSMAVAGEAGARGPPHRPTRTLCSPPVVGHVPWWCHNSHHGFRVQRVRPGI